MQKHWLTQREKRNESRHWHLSVGWGLRCGWQWLTLRTRSDWLRLRQPGQLHAHQPQTSQDTTLEHAGKQSPSECFKDFSESTQGSIIERGDIVATDGKQQTTYENFDKFLVWLLSSWWVDTYASFPSFIDDWPYFPFQKVPKIPWSLVTITLLLAGSEWENCLK